MKGAGIKTHSQGPEGTNRTLWPYPPSQMSFITLSMAQDLISAQPRTISPCPSDISSIPVTGLLFISPGLIQTYCFDLPAAHGASGARSCYHLSCPVHPPVRARSHSHSQPLVLSLRELSARRAPRQPVTRITNRAYRIFSISQIWIVTYSLGSSALLFLIYNKILHYLTIKTTQMPIKLQWEEVLKIRLKSWQFQSSIFPRVIPMHWKYNKCKSRTGALKEQITTITNTFHQKASAIKTGIFFFLASFFFFHDHEEKREILSASVNTGGEIATFCKNLANWSRIWWPWRTESWWMSP